MDRKFFFKIQKVPEIKTQHLLHTGNYWDSMCIVLGAVVIQGWLVHSAYRCLLQYPHRVQSMPFYIGVLSIVGEMLNYPCGDLKPLSCDCWRTALLQGAPLQAPAFLLRGCAHQDPAPRALAALAFQVSQLHPQVKETCRLCLELLLCPLTWKCYPGSKLG